MVRPSHLQIPGGPKMTWAALSTIDGSCVVDLRRCCAIKSFFVALLSMMQCSECWIFLFWKRTLVLSRSSQCFQEVVESAVKILVTVHYMSCRCCCCWQWIVSAVLQARWWSRTSSRQWMTEGRVASSFYPSAGMRPCTVMLQDLIGRKLFSCCFGVAQLTRLLWDVVAQW